MDEMKGKVIALRPCSRCGAPGVNWDSLGPKANIVIADEVFPDMKIPLTFQACEACVVEIAREISLQRPLFQALLDLGVDRKTANRMMIAKMDYEFKSRLAALPQGVPG